MFTWAVIATLCLILNGILSLKYPNDYGPTLFSGKYETKFDFIVVGGGSAGATVATRLSEIPEWNVLLLEAGGDPPEFSEIPLMFSELTTSKYDWGFRSQPEKHLFKGLAKERTVVSRGMMLGGTSSMNGMMYMRGTKQDFDTWQRLGNTGWGFDDVLPYFFKSENFTDNSRYDPKLHARGGPLTVSPMAYADPLIPVFAEAKQSLNLSWVDDLNRITPPVVGYGRVDSTVRNGLRCSTLKAFLMPASNRSNLFVSKNTRVTRVIFDKDTAIGVEFLTPSGESRRVYSTHEVILSAGVIMSPHILMISGVGPKDHLRSHSINVVSDLPVGYNYQDHAIFPGLVFSERKNRSKSEIADESDNLTRKMSNLTSSGIGTLGITDLMSFIKTDNSLEYPDLQLLIFRLPFNNNRKTFNSKSILTNLFAFSEEVAKLFDDLNALSDTLLLLPTNLNVRSTGRVMLQSTNPIIYPKIHTNYLSHDEEIETLLRGIDFVVEMSKTEPIIKAGLVLEHIQFPNCANHTWSTRDYWLCAMKNIAVSLYHPVGTCKMGPSNDNLSVVDLSLNVKGTRKLRVIDSSIMPKVVSVNTNAATIMIAEKGCDEIKRAYGKIV